MDNDKIIKLSKEINEIKLSESIVTQELIKRKVWMSDIDNYKKVVSDKVSALVDEIQLELGIVKK